MDHMYPTGVGKTHLTLRGGGGPNPPPSSFPTIDGGRGVGFGRQRELDQGIRGFPESHEVLDA
ncbi:hypothetical protein Taro_023349, partial [Colocasia esculenta]|nr:hypothetical protein [Colocasia esculenta]